MLLKSGLESSFVEYFYTLWHYLANLCIESPIVQPQHHFKLINNQIIVCGVEIDKSLHGENFRQVVVVIVDDFEHFSDFLFGLNPIKQVTNQFRSYDFVLRDFTIDDTTKNL